MKNCWVKASGDWTGKITVTITVNEDVINILQMATITSRTHTVVKQLRATCFLQPKSSPDHLLACCSPSVDLSPHFPGPSHISSPPTPLHTCLLLVSCGFNGSVATMFDNCVRPS